MQVANDTGRATEALYAIPADLPREDWVRVGMAAQAAGLDFDVFNDWSSQAGSYNERDARDTWRSFKPGKGVGAGTLYRVAAERGGWRMEAAKPQKPVIRASRTALEPVRRHGQGVGSPESIWSRCEPATDTHDYIRAKQGLPDGLRVIPAGDPLRVAGESMAGALVLPVVRSDGTLSSLQLIAPNDTAERLKEAGKPGKLNLPGASLDGWFTVGQLKPGAVMYICEGIGAAWSCWRATGDAAVVAFGWGRVRGVAHALRERDPSARLVLVPDIGKEFSACESAREVGAAVALMPDGWPENSDVNDLARRDGHDVLGDLLAKAACMPPEPLPFAVVPFEDSAEPLPPAFIWEGLVPVGHVTLFGAHGGTGKSMVALMLGVATAMGLPLFGIPTRQGAVAFYSAEDGEQLLRYRLHTVCRGMGVRVEDLAGKLFILDATEGDPTLFTEVAAGGRKEGTTTKAYAALRKFVEDKNVRLLVVDNASDAFDASEIDRARVRGFMRALALIARQREGGVLMLAHVDKGTSRGERAGTEGYSGSTAWNNSARSRLFMSRDKEGVLVLEQQKHNLGKLQEPVRIVWPEGGVPQRDEPFGPVVAGIEKRSHEAAILKLIAEYTARGEHITTATTSRTHAGKLLRHESTFPRIKDAEVFDLLRKAERAGHLGRVNLKGSNRHEKECWHVTPAGAAFARIPAPTAPTAPTSVVSAPDAVDAEGCADCADFGARGCGGNAGAQEVSASAGTGD